MIMLDYDSLHSWADRHWESSIIPSLSEFISIEALSPGFEPEWERKGELQGAIDLFCKWVEEQNLDGCSMTTLSLEGRTPILIINIQGTASGEVLFYSHLDKQPSKPWLWSEGLSPLKAVRRDPWLFGRGSVDDGYGGYLCISAIKALQEHDLKHPSATFLIETCEESGSSQ